MTDYRNDIKEILLTEEQLAAVTSRLADTVRREYAESPRKLILVCILKGSIVFTGDLMKKLNIPAEVECMKASSYGSSTVSSGNVNVRLDLPIPLEEYPNLDLLLVEDIVDTGRTLACLTALLKERGAGSVRTCTLLDKPARRTVDFKPDYVGCVIPDAFVVGYGLDYGELYRNLPFVGILKEEVYASAQGA